MNLNRIAKKLVAEFKLKDEDVSWSDMLEPYSDEEIEEREKKTKKDQDEKLSRVLQGTKRPALLVAPPPCNHLSYTSLVPPIHFYDLWHIIYSTRANMEVKI